MQLAVMKQRLGVDFTFAWDNNAKKKNPHLFFFYKREGTYRSEIWHTDLA